MEHPIPFHTLVEFVEAEDDTNEKNRTLDLSPVIIKVSSKLEFQNLSVKTFTKATDPNNESKPHFRKFCTYCHKSNHSVSNCFRKQREDAGRKQNKSFSRSKSFVMSF